MVTHLLRSNRMSIDQIIFAKKASDHENLVAAQVRITAIDEIESYIVANFPALTDELKALLDKARAENRYG